MTPTKSFVTQIEALRLAEECARILREEFGARRVIPFGSVRGDSPWHDQSDLDLAVEGLPPELEAKAWSTLEALMPPGLELDLVELETAPVILRESILGEAEMPDDNRKALILEMRRELGNLQLLTEELEQFLESCIIDPENWTTGEVRSTIRSAPCGG